MKHLKFYFRSSSYPELRCIPTSQARHKAWWRGIESAVNEKELWVFVAIHLTIAMLLGVVITFILHQVSKGTTFEPYCLGAGGASGLAYFLFMAITLGAKLIHPHLCRTTSACRTACPSCGYNLKSQIREELPANKSGRMSNPICRAIAQNKADLDLESIQCSECGYECKMSDFIDPFKVQCEEENHTNRRATTNPSTPRYLVPPHTH